MFRWNLMLRTLFGVRYDQAKARRPKETVKLRLEVLEDRTMLSVSPANPFAVVAVASPPAAPQQLAAVTSLVDSTLNQYSHLIATFQSDVFADALVLSQEIAQAESAAMQQWGRLIGLQTIASNQVHGSPVQKPNSGSGSGSGSNTGHSTPPAANPPTHPPTLRMTPKKAGSGIGTNSDPGSYGTATVTGEVWLDNNGDNLLDNNEMGIQGITVNLFSTPPSGGGGLVATTQTNNTNGINYQFQNIPVPLAGGESQFQIQVMIPSGDFITESGENCQVDTDGSSAIFGLTPGGAVNISAGLKSMNVTTSLDDPNGPTPATKNLVTLRDAIQTGNNGPPAPAVTFSPVLTGTTNTPQQVLPSIQKSYNIQGLGSSKLTVDGNYNAGTLFTVNAGVTSTISGLTITRGAGANGGGIYNQGNLTLDDIVLNKNQTAGNGGGIANATGAKLLLEDVTLTNNTATQKGGGLYNSGSATMLSAMFKLNEASMGGGIYNYGSMIAPFLSENEIVDNTATGQGGGGVYNWGKFQMDGGTISTNRATAAGPGVGNGGGIYQRIQKMTLSGVAIQGNDAAIGRRGGGIYVANGTLTLNSDTLGGPALLQGNAAGVGGGLYESLGTVKMVEGTVSNNVATITGVGAGVQNGGGGIFVGGGSLTLTKVPVKNNGSRFNGGGIDIAGSATPSVKITAGSIANNTAGNSGGGIYTMNGSLTLIGQGAINNLLPVSNNTAANQGGGLYLGNGSTTTFNGVGVTGNKAFNAADGNGVYCQTVNGIGAIVNGLPGGLNDPDDGGNPVKGP